jgi:hypothetical protein
MNMQKLFAKLFSGWWEQLFHFASVNREVGSLSKFDEPFSGSGWVSGDESGTGKSSDGVDLAQSDHQLLRKK